MVSLLLINRISAFEDIKVDKGLQDKMLERAGLIESAFHSVDLVYEKIILLKDALRRSDVQTFETKALMYRLDNSLVKIQVAHAELLWLLSTNFRTNMKSFTKLGATMLAATKELWHLVEDIKQDVAEQDGNILERTTYLGVTTQIMLNSTIVMFGKNLEKLSWFGFSYWWL